MKLETQQTIARNLRILRTQNAISQVRMAVDIGMTRLSYAAYENGSITPDAEVLYKIALRYGVPMDAFFIENVEDFISRISKCYYYDDSMALLVESYEKLSNFAKGMLLEKTLQLLEQDKIIKANRAKLEERKPKKPGSK